jgi:hypothetical protein
MSETTGRRSLRRGFSLSPFLVIGILLPLLTVGTLALVRPQTATTQTATPTTTPLTSSAAVCPAATPGAATVAAATLGNASGADFSAVTRAGGDAQPLRLCADGPTTVTPRSDGVVLRGEGKGAGRLVATEAGTRANTLTTCPAPAAISWFTGVGAGARHTSTLQLTNPDQGPAVADVDVYGHTKQIEVPRLRGVTVRGGETVRIDLGTIFPRRVDLTLGLTVSRGRLVSHVLDTVPALGTRRQTAEWLPAQAEPSTSSLLLGLPDGHASDTLVVANPGNSETRVQVRVVTQDAAFTPQGLDDIRVPPGATSLTSLTQVLDKAVKDGALGIQVTADAPVTASLRSTSGGDLSYAAPVRPTDQPTLAPVPDRPASVVLGEASGAGVVTVTAYARGRQVLSRRVALTEGSGGLVDLPKGTDLVRVEPQRASVSAALRVTKPGTAVIPLLPPVEDALIPQVRPDLP